MSVPVLITPRVINECIQSVSPPYPPFGLTVVLCLSDGLQQQFVLLHADTCGERGSLVALQGGLVTPKELWWPLWCPCEVWWLYREVGGPTRVLVALQGGLVTPKELWWSLWCPCEVWWSYKGVWWPYRGSW